MPRGGRPYWRSWSDWWSWMTLGGVGSLSAKLVENSWSTKASSHGSRRSSKRTAEQTTAALTLTAIRNLNKTRRCSRWWRSSLTHRARSRSPRSQLTQTRWVRLEHHRVSISSRRRSSIRSWTSMPGNNLNRPLLLASISRWRRWGLTPPALRDLRSRSHSRSPATFLKSYQLVSLASSHRSIKSSSRRMGCGRWMKAQMTSSASLARPPERSSEHRRRSPPSNSSINGPARDCTLSGPIWRRSLMPSSLLTLPAAPQTARTPHGFKSVSGWTEEINQTFNLIMINNWLCVFYILLICIDGYLTPVNLNHNIIQFKLLIFLCGSSSLQIQFPERRCRILNDSKIWTINIKIII